MNKDDVKKLIEQNSDLLNFIKGEKACLTQNIEGVNVSIFKEIPSNVNYYYNCPYSSTANYKVVGEYMAYAIPILEELLEKSDDDKLFTSNCIR